MMATIRNTISGSFRAEIRKRQKLIHSKTFSDLEQAESNARLYEENIKRILGLTSKELKKISPKEVDKLGCIELFQKLNVEIEFLTFHILIDQFLKQWPGKDIVNQSKRACYWKQHIEDIPVKSIKPKHIRKVLGKLSNTVKPDGTVLSSNTVRRYRSVLSAICNFAIEQNYIKENPLKHITVKATPNQIVRYLSDIERTSLLDACQQSSWDKLYLLVLMAITTGMRKSELMKLRWSDIDFNTELAYLSDTKNGEPRVNPIPAPAMQELRKFRQIGNQFIFNSPNKPDKPFEFVKQWKNALAQANITTFRFHDLRHTAASYLVMNGGQLA